MTKATDAVDRLALLLNKYPSSLDATNTMRKAMAGEVACVSADVINRVCDELERLNRVLAVLEKHGLYEKET